VIARHVARLTMHDRPRAMLFVAVGVASVGAAAPLIRLTEAPAVSAAFLRTLLGGLLLLVLCAALRRPLPRGADLRRSVVCGVVLGAHFALWFASLLMTSVAASTVLVCVQPVFVAALSFVFIGERTPSRGLWGIGIAVAGAAAIAVDGPASGGGERALWGNALALAGALVIAVYPLVARRLSPAVDTLGFSATTTLFASATLWLCCIATSSPTWSLVADGRGRAAVVWPAVLGLALLPTVIGQTSLNAALRVLPAAVVSGAILGEPVIAAFIAWLVFDERPGPLSLVGSAGVLAGVALLLRAAPPPART
jgi:drug/metabolite transporter (DMT)-like permease